MGWLNSLASFKAFSTLAIVEAAGHAHEYSKSIIRYYRGSGTPTATIKAAHDLAFPSPGAIAQYHRGIRLRFRARTSQRSPLMDFNMLN